MTEENNIMAEEVKEEPIVENSVETDNSVEIVVPSDDKSEAETGNSDSVESSSAEAVIENIPEAVAIEEEIEEEEESFVDLAGDWYILQVYTGYENKVKTSLDQRIGDMGLQDKIFKVLIPEEDTVEIKNNKRVETRKKMYPGYIFINMKMDDDVWASVKQVTGVARFIGGGSDPEPVVEGEMLRVLKHIGAKVKKIEIDFEIGENVRVIAGPFRGYTGAIKEINADRGKVKVLMSIFGRETPMELEFDQLEKNA